MRKSHVLVIPYPAQGHVNPLMDISRFLANKHDIKITFVNTEFNHNRVMHTLTNNNNNYHRSGDNSSSLWSDNIHLVSIPDGLGPEEDRKDLIKLCNAILRDMPATLEELINTTNEESEGENGQITCVLVDAHMGWALEVADKMGIKGALVWPASATLFALQISIPRLIDEGIIDNDNGMPIKEQMYQLSTNMPAINTTNFQWSCFLHLAANTTIYEYIRRYLTALDTADWWVCNSSYELEPEAFSLVPKLKPIGPFMAGHHLAGNVGAQFWTEDSTCLNWLDEHPVHSVIYVAFGSFTLLDQTQFEELAHGLVLSNRPFLWVDRPGFKGGPGHAYPDGFPGTNGKIVEWAPQQKVLSHPAVACFLSHCGWNSTIEGLSNGVPFLCWPYFADQPMNKDLICDVWKVGLKFDSGESGIITRDEVKKKVKKLLGDGDIRARSSKIKEMCVNNMAEGGRSSNNSDDFIEWLKA